MERGAWIETQSSPWKVARGVSERARARAAQGSAWARARPGTKHTVRRAAENGHLEVAIAYFFAGWGRRISSQSNAAERVRSSVAPLTRSLGDSAYAKTNLSSFAPFFQSARGTAIA